MRTQLTWIEPVERAQSARVGHVLLWVHPAPLAMTDQSLLNEMDAARQAVEASFARFVIRFFSLQWNCFCRYVVEMLTNRRPSNQRHGRRNRDPDAIKSPGNRGMRAGLTRIIWARCNVYVGTAAHEWPHGACATDAEFMRWPTTQNGREPSAIPAEMDRQLPPEGKMPNIRGSGSVALVSPRCSR